MEGLFIQHTVDPKRKSRSLASRSSSYSDQDDMLNKITKVSSPTEQYSTVTSDMVSLNGLGAAPRDSGKENLLGSFSSRQESISFQVSS